MYRPAIISVDQLAEAAQLGADLAVEDRNTVIMNNPTALIASEPLIKSTTVGYFPPPPEIAY